MNGSSFDFITPVGLRKNIIESVKFAGFLWTLAEVIDEEFQDETLRTIILYNISVIEALLLFRIKKNKIPFTETEYKHLSALPAEFKKRNLELVVGYKKIKKKPESRIWLHEMIRIQEDFLGDSLAKEITELQNIRNTFHLSRARDNISLTKASQSFDTVLQLVDKLRE